MKNWKMMMFSLFFLGMTCSIAWASYRIEVKATSEPIPQCSKNGKAGGFSLEFDENTVFTVGDKFTIDVDWGVTISQDVDIVIAPAADVLLDPDTKLYISGTLFDETNIPVEGNGAFAQSAEGVAVAGSNGGIVFHVYGTKGTQRITIDVLGPLGGTLTVGSNPTTWDVVALNILDERTNAIGADPAGSSVWPSATIWEKGTTANLYNDSADQNDNTLYINISEENFTRTIVNANMDSKLDKYTFIPSNPQIAHLTELVPSDSPGEINVIYSSVPITSGNEYAATGSLIFKFTSGTILSDGDQIYITLGNNTFLSKDIDLEISLNGQGQYWTRDAILGNDSNGPLYYVDDPADGGVSDEDCEICRGIIFRLTGTASRQTLTLSVSGGYLKVGSESQDAFIFKLFDQQTNTDFINDGIWIDVDRDGIYGETGEDATKSHNTLRVDASRWNGTVLSLNLDSSNDKYTFIPSNPQIGHLVAGSVLGDINGDGKVGLEEAIHALRVVAGIED